MREIEESIESTIDRSWIEIRINKKKIEISPHSAKFSTAIFQRTRLPWEINLCNLDVSSYIVVRDATCTPRRQFFWRTLSYAFARRGETEDMRRAVDLLPCSFDRNDSNPAGKGENLAQVIVPIDFPETLLLCATMRRKIWWSETFNQNCLESDEEFVLIYLLLNRTFGFILRIFLSTNRNRDANILSQLFVPLSNNPGIAR